MKQKFVILYTIIVPYQFYKIIIRYIFEINKSFTTFILGQLHKKYHITLFMLVLLFCLKTILLQTFLLNFDTLSLIINYSTQMFIF